MITPKEYWERIVKATDDGTFPAFGEHGCKYRIGEKADAKQRCIFGILIPDEKYEVATESWMADFIAIHNPERFENVEGFAPEDYRNLQRIHDSACDIRPWDKEGFLNQVRNFFILKGVKL